MRKRQFIQSFFLILLFISILLLYNAIFVSHEEKVAMFTTNRATANYSYTILTKPFPNMGNKLNRLFEMDRKQPGGKLRPTRDYTTICGGTMLLDTRVCTNDLREIQPSQVNKEVVPNLVHYLLPYPNGNISFYHVVSILSSYWILKPTYLIIWYQDNKPQGENWEYLKKNLTSNGHGEGVLLIALSNPGRIYEWYNDNDKHMSFYFMRLELLYWFGGIYLNPDVIVVKSMKSLMIYPFSIGRETVEGLSANVMISSRENPLLLRWHLFFRFLHKFELTWDDMTSTLLGVIYLFMPDLFHVEDESLARPNKFSPELSWIFESKNVWNWKELNYCVNLWINTDDLQPSITMDSIQSNNSMFGEIARFILFGNSEKVIH